MAVERTGPTPRGGTRSVAHLFAGDGTEVDDPGIAVRGEIRELDDNGVELGRTYFDNQPRTDPDAFDVTTPSYDGNGNEPESSDLLKLGSWDIWHIEDGVWKHPVRTRDQLLRALQAQGTEREEFSWLCNFIGLPVWESAPKELKDDVYSWLESHRQE